MTDFNVEETLAQLTLKEKVALLSLRDFWHLTPVERLNIPAIRLSDGPNGVRGTKFFKSVPSACFSCGTGLGSTWDTELLEEAGHLMSVEARHKGAHAILGPTCNIQRGPLGGRGFESFSEDQYLSGMASAAIVNGIQKGGVAATIKHFVCNDLEDERNSINSIVSERALREVYLMPFQLATKYANPKSFMTAYNKVNGTHVSQSKKLLDGVLRGEWGWDGMIMSDWFGCYSIEQSIEAGLDLECPGSPLIRKHDSLIHQIMAREIPMPLIDERVTNILKFIKFALQSGIPSDGPEDTKNNTPETSAFLRKLADDAIVLLKNEGGLLPLKKEDKIAVIGPGAKSPRTFGGGSASLNPYYQTNVLDAVKKHLGTDDVSYALGSEVELALYDLGKVVSTEKGAGFHIKVYNKPVDAEDRIMFEDMTVESSKFLLFDYFPKGAKEQLFYLDMEGDFTPEVTGEYAFQESCLGSN
ncbi:unnamed protein product [Ambrosiozyma monospora]|uniref:beta-glucosidase n=1 Tax=Ambrosiozyma monospora TaxID=43982 RepID=A0A9W6Z1G6_AMBMO|nr:unnamed protein product [Ambrosiozyma monospora]